MGFSPQVPEWQQAGHNEYDPSLSSTARLLSNATWAVHYGDGGMSNGNVVIDRVSIGGITAPSEAVETAQNVIIELFGNPRADEIVGFSFSERNKGKGVSF
jgi:aspergillopepsin I